MKTRKFFLRWQALLLSAVLVSLAWSTPVLCATVTLAWDPNREADLKGYGVYFRQNAAGPYSLAGYVTVGELPNPSLPSFAVTGLQEGGRYFFAATAYNTAGAESAFSSAVCADIAVGGVVSVCPSSITDSPPTGGAAVGSSSGGGGGQCFIGSLSQGIEGPGTPVSLGLILAGAFACLLLLRGRRAPH
ncbi:MAG: fibronectin type III domain-containing protein [Desulfobacterales bacterium]|jgi:hypothetical protein|nr:fibronectin type III domain-containing protein [Desulfobacterales bacterium]